MKIAAQLSMLLALAAGASGAQRWKLQYFFDDDKETFHITDLQFASAKRGLAVGYAETDRGKTRPMAVVTSDGGKTWAPDAIRNEALSLFFLNEGIGWMVTSGGIYKTEEVGRTWKKLPSSPKGTTRVHFLDRQHGFAVGAKRGLWETFDGGAVWKPVAAAEEVKSDPRFTQFIAVDFVTPTAGAVVGFSRRPRPLRPGRPNLPDWMDPENARSEWPGMVSMLTTLDAGKSWSVSSASVFGVITKMKLLPQGAGLGLIEFSRAFSYPSEVFRIEARSGKNSRVYRDAARKITDVRVLPDGLAMLGGVEVPGKLATTPVPGKVKILYSKDLANWSEMEVDYRAVGTRVILASAGQEVWAATDSGMILRLEH